ncbi:MAG: exo-alpha-sialidase [Clostridia bacterium]|nr:exo-alpha-sialidase [Clostridia bacterium]
MKKIGRQVHFIPTSENNPRNGEGAFIRLENNSILFGYTEFTGDDSKNDDAKADIYTLVSTDNGETWGNKKILFRRPESALNIMNLSFLRMQNGDIGAFFIIKIADGTDRIVFTRSSDEAESWSEPINCLDCVGNQDYYVMNNDRAVMLRSGRILLPLARHTIYTDSEEFQPGVMCFVYSDDDGRSWKKTDSEFVFPFPTNPDGYQEPGVYELDDGRIWCYIRTDTGFQFECFSSDDGFTWTVPEPNLFFSSPCSPMHVKDFSDLTLAVFNPVPEHVMRTEREDDFWGRTPYVIAVSTDKGKTFTREKLFYIEDDLTKGYCYPAIFDCGDSVLIAYYHSYTSDCCLNSQKIIKIDYDELKS